MKTEISPKNKTSQEARLLRCGVELLTPVVAGLLVYMICKVGGISYARDLAASAAYGCALYPWVKSAFYQHLGL